MPSPRIIGHLDADCFYVSAERVRRPHAVSLLRQPAPPVVAPAGTPSRTGNAPRAEECGTMTRIHPALAEVLLLLALAGWLRLASGLG